ncbi:MAG TPA: xanthine dehydrogenase family protein molybdopterin-binding subunit [Candidatus Limnocylindria bacterium]|jgi:carbon-monoxide dehydrogenase large subunit|nr:xanthine dehydrogenase family protein molybdopterin-binding subunit [Candidatus Limnocylindria bacterium]
MTTATTPTYIGARVARKEDPRLITGDGTFTDDVTLPGMVYVSLVRSPHAHANIRRIDTAAAKKEPGVVAVLTGKDLEATGMLPVFITVPNMSGSKHMPIAADKARYAGDAVAAVVAETRDAAKRAADAITVDYEPLPVVVDATAALEPGAPIIHEELKSNLVFTYPVKGGDIEKAFKDAEVKTSLRIVNQRLIPNAMEPRAVAARFEAGELTLWSTTQIPHFVQLIASLNLGLSQNKVRVIAPEVGGGFGSKLQVYAEELLVGYLAKTLGRPVKWTEERREGYLATIHGRDHVSDLELAAKRDGTLLGLRVRTVANVGAYLQAFAPGIPTILHMFVVPGPYRLPAYDYEMRGAYTNTTPVDAYRGAGRPEAAYLIERAMDRLADEIGMDPAELRRKNFIPKDAFPFNTISGISYDSGDYAPALDRALAMADYKGFEKRRAEAKARGNYRGIGISSYIEICGLAPSKANAALGVGWGGYESARIRVHPTGAVQVFTGTSPHGQGHETSWAQIAADALGVTPNDIEVRHGDTFESPGMGVGTFGSRSLAVGGIAVHKAAEKVREKVVQIGAHLLEASPADVVVEGGKVFVKGVPEKAKNFGDISMAAYLANNLPEGMEPGLEATVYYDPPNFTFPFGTHIAEVEIDGETGAVRIVRYSACDDCGRQINPMIVEGQLHGGIAQGIGQALYETAVYDENGQLLSGSMMEYHVPTAEDIPAFQLDHTVTLSPSNPLGVKGIGEAGTIGSTPAVANAVIDALSPLGIRHLDMPLTSEKIWKAMKAAGEGRR